MLSNYVNTHWKSKTATYDFTLVDNSPPKLVHSSIKNTFSPRVRFFVFRRLNVASVVKKKQNTKTSDFYASN